ncbi:MAG: hypothetical protein ACRENW_05175, partial [Thermodesulfobacteriota bacterium]
IRLEFIVPAEDCDLATDAIESMNGEATIYEAESCGCKKRKFKMTVNKGTDTMEITKPRRRTIVSIVEAEEADSIVAAVAGAVSTGSSSVIRSPVYGVETL